MSSPSASADMSIDLPKITVVTPSYNQAAFLETTIQSVLGQFYPNLEYIVMDGGSTDGSVEVIKRYESQITYWQSQRDKGQADAINQGFARATGDILCWLNSDDIHLPGALQRIAKLLAPRLHEPALIYGGTLFFRDDADYAKAARSRKFDREFLGLQDYILQPSSFWTAALWKACGPLDASLSFAFDWDWYLRAAKIIDLTPTENLLSGYRLHRNQKTGTGGDKRRAEIVEVASRHGTPSQKAAYAFALGNWAALQECHERTRMLQKSRIPLAPRVARLLSPSLPSLPEGVEAATLDICRYMLTELQ